MSRSQLTGSRIRAARMDRRLRQAELARRCEISASYLNLIEHNRRRIGGALLNRLAKVLDVDPASLSEGAEATLTSAVESAAVRHPDTGAETNRAEDFAGRFPGFARLIEAQYRETLRLERVIEGLNDRLTHDPFLSASLHDVLSSVTAIRSASAILADDAEIAPEWQARFHRNIFEDSRRLTQSTEQLVSYLDAGADTDRGMSLPHEDVESWLEHTRWSVPELEEEPGADIDAIVEKSDALGSSASRHLARAYLNQYAADAAAVPLDVLREAVEAVGSDPSVLAVRFGVTLPVVFRRLSALPEEAFPDRQARGLVACDASGTLVFRKPMIGFDLPRYGAACPLWPLFLSLQRPMQPIRQCIRTTGRDVSLFTAWAFAEIGYPAGIDGPAVVEAWMLLDPQQNLPEGGQAVDVGTSCRICAQPDCPARREPSLVAPTRAGEEEQLMPTV